VEPTPYDFRRPIQLSREHSRMLQLTLDGFCRQATTVFTSSLRTVCMVSLTSIEQRTYAEYIDSLDSSTYLTVFSAEPLFSQGVLELPLVAIMTCVDHMLGGPGRPDQPQRPLTEIEASVAGGMIERLLGEMRYSMAAIVSFDPVVRGVEYSPQFAQVAGASDVMVAASLELKINERSFRMTMCMPFSGLLPHLVRAAAPSPVSERERAQRERSAAELHAQFERVPIDVAVRLRPTSLGPGDLAALAPGDVIRLNHPSAAPLEVVADGISFAHATAGTSGVRLAALIVGTPKETS
jgi:flagellar motor switch protein FliM